MTQQQDKRKKKKKKSSNRAFHPLSTSYEEKFGRLWMRAMGYSGIPISEEGSPQLSCEILWFKTSIDTSLSVQSSPESLYREKLLPSYNWILNFDRRKHLTSLHLYVFVSAAVAEEAKNRWNCCMKDFRGYNGSFPTRPRESFSAANGLTQWQ